LTCSGASLIKNSITINPYSVSNTITGSSNNNASTEFPNPIKNNEKTKEKIILFNI